LPAGSSARIYLPGTAPDEVLDLAKSLYRARRLVRIDGQTLQCDAEGISYLPIPSGAQIDHAGLLTIDLPPGVRRGQRFDVTVRQLTHVGRLAKGFDPFGTHDALDRLAAQGSRLLVWEHVIGSFQVTIPISKGPLLLDDETRLLSVLRWILGQVPQRDRWYLPYLRYVGQIGERVGGFGGDPDAVVPDPNGLPASPKPGGNGELGREHGYTGKVSGILYDRYGDFEGFTLDTPEGERLFRSREHTVEDLAQRAWRERTLIVVYVDEAEPQRPEAILFKYGPKPYWG
jgi:hypothetical protein